MRKILSLLLILCFCNYMISPSFAGESEARNKYTYFASKAKKDGYDKEGNTLKRVGKWIHMYYEM